MWKQLRVHWRFCVQILNSDEKEYVLITTLVFGKPKRLHNLTPQCLRGLIWASTCTNICTRIMKVIMSEVTLDLKSTHSSSQLFKWIKSKFGFK